MSCVGGRNTLPRKACGVEVVWAGARCASEQFLVHPAQLGCAYRLRGTQESGVDDRELAAVRAGYQRPGHLRVQHRPGPLHDQPPFLVEHIWQYRLYPM